VEVVSHKGDTINEALLSAEKAGWHRDHNRPCIIKTNNANDFLFVENYEANTNKRISTV
jgi:hypothetical protein